MFSSQQSQVSSDTLYVEDVFSTFTYTGNGSTQSIVNGIDLAGKGGMTWLKGRSGATDHQLFDTARTATKELISNSTAAEATDADTLTAFNSNGFALGADANINTNAATYVAWTFRKAPKFFDVVTYTGDGSANRAISHSLGQVPGMIVVKKLSGIDTWFAQHRSLGPTKYIALNNSDIAYTNAQIWNDTEPTSSVFTLGTNSGVNQSGHTYVAYLFAHDTATDGIVQCGSFTTDGSGNATVNLGWEPQFLLLKTTSAANNWTLFDTARGMTAGGGAGAWNHLYPNLSNAAADAGVGLPNGTNSTGFSYGANASTTHIYLAIRRGPMKAPTSGTQVYSAIGYSGDDTESRKLTGVGFPPDLSFIGKRSSFNNRGFDRLRGAGKALDTAATTAEASITQMNSFDQDGLTVSLAGSSLTNQSGGTYINWNFRRYPGVFDQVCWTAGASTDRRLTHNLGASPELLITKRRNAAGEGWLVYTATTGISSFLELQSTAAKTTSANVWGASAPTATDFGINEVNACISGGLYTTYLFATLAGISKVGSYTGTGTTLQIDCGFAAGARFVLIKRTDSTGDWYVWDSTRGIIAGNDPFLLLNSTAAEGTGTDYIDPLASGFEISSTAPAAINASGGSFVFLAFA